MSPGFGPLILTGRRRLQRGYAAPHPISVISVPLWRNSRSPPRQRGHPSALFVSRRKRYTFARMRAIRVAQFGGPEVLTLTDVPDPAPGPGEVVVQLHAAGVNPVEAYVRTGNYARL